MSISKRRQIYMNNNEPYSARFGDGSDVDDLIYGDDRNISQR